MSAADIHDLVSEVDARLAALEVMASGLEGELSDLRRAYAREDAIRAAWEADPREFSRGAH